MNNEVKQKQDAFLDSLVKFFKEKPDQSFTAGSLIKTLGLKAGKSNWYMHAHLNILKEEGKLKKLDERKGFKIKD